MKVDRVIQRFAALAHETRLAVFRCLVEAGPGGLPAGEIAARVGVSPSGLSFHAAILERAGLLNSRRDGRSVIYLPDLAAATALADFLLDDCCGGRPELCDAQARPEMNDAKT